MDAATASADECLRLGDGLAAAVVEDIQTLARRARLRIALPTTGRASSEPDPRIRLTDRELEVLGLVVKGRSNGQIAAALYISPKTASVMCQTSCRSSTSPPALRRLRRRTGKDC